VSAAANAVDNTRTAPKAETLEWKFMKILPINPPCGRVDPKSRYRKNTSKKPTTSPEPVTYTPEKKLHTAGKLLASEYADTRPNRISREFN
jgi:hypothetical protein